MLGIQIKPRHRKIIEMISHHKMRFLVAMLCSVLVSLTTAASAWLLKPAIDDVFISKDVAMLKLFPLLIIGLFVLRGIGIYGQEYMMSYVGQDIIRRLRNGLYDCIQELPLSFFQEEKTGVLMSRITNDVNVSNLCTGRATSFIELAELAMMQAGYLAEIRTNPKAPVGVAYRVGDPKKMLSFYEPKISLEEGIARAFAD